MVPMEMNNLKRLEDFNIKITRWESDGYDCKLSKDFVSNLRYVNLFLLWNIGLTVRIRKFGLISSLLEVNMGTLHQGVKYVQD